MIYGSRLYFESTAACLAVAGIALSWWSFVFAEEGATPDNVGDMEGALDILGDIMFGRGVRARARLTARALFFTGGLFVAGSSTMGLAADFAGTRPDWPEIGTYLIVFAGLAYLARGVLQVWRNRRGDAFGMWFGKDAQYLYDKEKSEAIFFRDNPMPFWSVFNREWRSSVKRPDIQEVAAKASKVNPFRSTVAPADGGCQRAVQNEGPAL